MSENAITEPEKRTGEPDELELQDDVITPEPEELVPTKPKADQLYRQNYALLGDRQVRNQIVKALEPTIGYALSSLGMQGDPVLRAEAKVIASESLDKFNPNMGASLNTYVANQLRQLSRKSRQLKSPVTVSDRAQMELYKIHNATQEYMDSHDREPDMAELADLTGIPLKKVKKLMENQVKVVNEGALDTAQLEHMTPDYNEEAMDYVYEDSNYADRKIMEYRAGYGGAEEKSPKELAEMLNMSQSQISRRAARIGMRINDIAAALRGD